MEKYKGEAVNQQHLDVGELERLRMTLAERETEVRNLKALTEQLRAELATFKDTATRLTADKDSIQKQLDTQLLKNDVSYNMCYEVVLLSSVEFNLTNIFKPVNLQFVDIACTKNIKYQTVQCSQVN